MGANKSIIKPEISDEDIYMLIEKTGQTKDVINDFIDELFYICPNGNLNQELFYYFFKKLYLRSFVSLKRLDEAATSQQQQQVDETTTTTAATAAVCNCNATPALPVAKKRMLSVVTPPSNQRSLSLPRQSIQPRKSIVNSLLPASMVAAETEAELMERIKIQQALEFSSFSSDKVEKATMLAEKCFESFDLEKRGYLTISDLFISYITTTDGDLKKKLEYTFKYYDKNRDRSLDRSEIKCIVRVMYNMLDMNNENNEYMDYNSCVDYIIKRLDDNGDGVISLEEFSNNLLSDEILCNLLAPFNSKHHK